REFLSGGTRGEERGMSGRGGGGRATRGCSTPSLPKPLRATIPYQLQKSSALLSARPPKPTIRRTLSLDTIIGPYLQGHWPKEAESTAATCVNDKATQTPSSWAEDTRGRRSAGGHKRSASWGSAEHLKEVSIHSKEFNNDLFLTQTHSRLQLTNELLRRIRCCLTVLVVPLQTMSMTPLNRLAPRLRRSIEGLSLELEEVFVSENADDQHEVRVPTVQVLVLIPLSICADPVDCETSCPSPSTSLPSFALELPVLQPCSSSPRPNKTFSFQRQPPEACERVRVCEEATSACQDEPLLQPSCPDPNKVNFTPHGGSAFCPVSLLKPLLPSMDLLFRGLSVSPVTGCSGQASPTRHLGMQ
uniref:Family with sequence similarity 117 member A n=1 Tax=Nothobranchius furzeri TaxID=105023 RepID=A0A8C6K9L3_NOTFU